VTLIFSIISDRTTVSDSVIQTFPAGISETGAHSTNHPSSISPVEQYRNAILNEFHGTGTDEA